MEFFTQLSYRERQKIYRGLCDGKSQKEIARELERSPSTISREIRRNSDHMGYLYAGEAHVMAQERKYKNTPKIDKNLELKKYIIEKLKARLSPIMIAKTWSIEKPDESITPEAIYQWIYGPEGEELKLKKLLIRAKKKRGMKRKKKTTGIKNRVSIHERPGSINERVEGRTL